MNRIENTFLAAVVVVIYIALPVSQDASAQPTPVAIRGVGVVDVSAGRLLPNQTVLVENGRIRSVGTNVDVPANARLIDGSEKFLVPGLWDMHVHIRHPRAPDILFPQFVAHGVTGVRDMSSDCREPEPGDTCADELREWGREIDSGERVGPRILALSSFPLNPPWDAEVSEEDARSLVRTIASRDVDLIKIYYRLSPEVFGWIMDEAKKNDLDVGGHIPIRITAAEASNAGLRSLEHARDFLFDCFPGSSDFRRTTTSQNPPMEVMRSMVDQHDVEQCDAEFTTFVRNGTWYVPTHVTRRMDAYADDPSFRNDPRSKYIPKRSWEAWQSDADGMVELDPTPEGRRVMRRFYETGLEITGRAYAAGVKIVLGTDAGDTYVFPGSGVHDELGELVKSGLSPAEALAAATLRAAEFLSVEEEYGSIERGKRADLVLVRANPLEDINAIRQIEVVMLGGTILSRGDLDQMLVDVVALVGE